MNELIFNGKNLVEFSAYVASSNFLDGAQKDIESVVIPGRSGEMHLNNNRFHNQTLKTTVYITENMQQNMAALRSYLNSCDGYCRYEESLDPDHYRMASFHSMFEPHAYDRVAGAITLEFDAYPQKWLKSGEEFVMFTSSGTIENPTLFPSFPLIRIVGSGTVVIGSITIEIAENEYEYIDIDCETMNASYQTTNANSYVSINTYDLLSLSPGENGVEIEGVGVVAIKPRWFEI